ncbi:Non-catalytic module family EXPN protein [Roridomyces roridus]|uniref:Non-catalytic module family EXPN protein n=1 Tax=Roridomyces roridus TaxID=1738132 RepID=A0AAD7BAG8_9AGAR|nr:Non-catalytic module family EXPN protein [Roridomyces roridus]
MQFIASFVLAALVAAGSALVVPRSSGPATFYDPAGALGACGNPIQNTDFAVALNTADFAGGALCGQNINVNFNGASITVNVQDLCPGCAPGGIDLTESAFAALADTSLGRIDVTWS